MLEPPIAIVIVDFPNQPKPGFSKNNTPKHLGKEEEKRATGPARLLRDALVGGGAGAEVAHCPRGGANHWAMHQIQSFLQPLTDKWPSVKIQIIPQVNIPISTID